MEYELNGKYVETLKKEYGFNDEAIQFLFSDTMLKFSALKWTEYNSKKKN